MKTHNGALLILLLASTTLVPAHCEIVIEAAWVEVITAASATGNSNDLESRVGLGVNVQRSVSANGAGTYAGQSASASANANATFDGLSSFTTSLGLNVFTSSASSGAGAVAYVSCRFSVDFRVEGQPMPAPIFNIGNSSFSSSYGGTYQSPQYSLANRNGQFAAGTLEPGSYRATVSISFLDNSNFVGGTTTSSATGSLLFGSASVAPGFNQANPVLPTPLPPQPGVPPGAEGGQFFQQPGRRWFDPPMAQGYTFTSTGAGLFKEIMAFPVGISATYSLTIEGQTYGPFTPEDSINFETLVGHGVSSFVLKGIKTPFVSATSPVAFPIMLDFTTETMDFTMVPILAPELQMATLPNGDLQLTFDGVLQSSDALSGWTDVTPAPTSPFVIPKAQVEGTKFFRASKP